MQAVAELYLAGSAIRTAFRLWLTTLLPLVELLLVVEEASKAKLAVRAISRQSTDIRRTIKAIIDLKIRLSTMM